MLNKEVKYIDITNMPELQPAVLIKGGKELVEARPAKLARKRPVPKGVLTEDDPLWKLFGSARSGEPTDASKKYEYLGQDTSQQTRRELDLRYEPLWVFIDSSGFLAGANSNDAFHEEAQALRRRITNERWITYTTNFVIAETHALFITRLRHRQATEFLRLIRQSNTNIVRVDVEDEERVDSIIFGYQDKIFSFTDATSFAGMQRLGISYAFSFDRSSSQYGFTALATEKKVECTFSWAAQLRFS